MGGKWGEEAPQMSTDLIITGLVHSWETNTWKLRYATCFQVQLQLYYACTAANVWTLEELTIMLTHGYIRSGLKRDLYRVVVEEEKQSIVRKSVRKAHCS